LEARADFWGTSRGESEARHFSPGLTDYTPPKMNETSLEKVAFQKQSSLPSKHHFSGDMLVSRGVWGGRNVDLMFDNGSREGQGMKAVEIIFWGMKV